MCGIAGAVWNDPELGIDAATLKQMADSLAHRGPDAEGFHLDSTGVALAHRRLSIIDLEGGRQPIANEDGSVWIVFNGEIYNYQELRARLGNHQFRTDSDTEVMVHLYEEMGDAFLGELRGMFAIALWDGRKRRLLLARDRFGKKPLVYHRQAGRVLFASQCKSLLQVPGVPRQVDPAALHEYLVYQYVPSPRTIYAGIEKLPPAHCAVFDDNGFHVRPYWEPNFNAEEVLPENEYRERLRTTLTEATRLRLRSDVPLGAFLSGGIDSTIVVGLMQQLMDRPAQTFSMRFPVAEYDESPYAEAAAKYLGTEHHTFDVDYGSLRNLPELVWHYDEPFADSSSIPTFLLAQKTRDRVTVALTGDAGDELFAGYPRYSTYRQVREWDALPWPLPNILRSRIWNWLPARDTQWSKIRKLQHRLASLRQSPSRRYLQWVQIFSPALLADLYTADFCRTLADHDPWGPILDAWSRCEQRDPITQGTVMDLLTYLPGALLTKVDVASMAFGLECRSPILDHEVVELAMKMPASLKVKGGVHKNILRETFADLMPPPVRGRGKMGFCVPLDHWFRGELAGMVDEILLDPRAIRRGYFDRSKIERMIAQHRRGEWNHGNALWSLIVLEMWHQTFLDGAAVPSTSPIKEWRPVRATASALAAS